MNPNLSTLNMFLNDVIRVIHTVSWALVVLGLILCIARCHGRHIIRLARFDIVSVTTVIIGPTGLCWTSSTPQGVASVVIVKEVVAQLASDTVVVVPAVLLYADWSLVVVTEQLRAVKRVTVVARSVGTPEAVFIVARGL